MQHLAAPVFHDGRDVVLAFREIPDGKGVFVTPRLRHRLDRLNLRRSLARQAQFQAGLLPRLKRQDASEIGLDRDAPLVVVAIRG